MRMSDWSSDVCSSDRAVQAAPGNCVTADASWSETPGLACAVLTADCLPVLFFDHAATRVAAAHAGWRGLTGGVLEATLEALAGPELGRAHCRERGRQSVYVYVAATAFQK